MRRQLPHGVVDLDLQPRSVRLRRVRRQRVGVQQGVVDVRGQGRGVVDVDHAGAGRGNVRHAALVVEVPVAQLAGRIDRLERGQQQPEAVVQAVPRRQGASAR